MIHPLELLDRWRRHLPGFQRWRRDSAAAATPPDQDWLREPTTLEEASALYPHLSQEQAMVRYQRFRLGMRWQRDQELS